MSVDTELDAWRRQWQAATDVPPDLRRKVQRQSRFMRITLASEIVVTVVIGGGATALAVRAPQAEYLVLAAVVWLLFAAAWTFGLVTRRGLWSPGAPDTAAFLELSIRRCRSRIKAAAFGTVLYFVEIVFCLTWIYQHDARSQVSPVRAFLGSTTVLAVSFVTVVFVAWIIMYRRRLRRELACLLDLQRESRGSAD